MCLDTLLKFNEKTIGYLTGSCMALTFGIFAALIMLQENSIDISDSKAYKIQTGCGAELLNGEHFNNSAPQPV